MQIINTPSTLTPIWYDQLTLLQFQEINILNKSDTLTLCWLDNGIAELAFDASGSVNKLDTQKVASLCEAISVLEKQPNLMALLLSPRKPAFIVGADITEFLSLFAAPAEELEQWLGFANDIFSRLEDLTVPTLSAIQGFALGGGCECILATDFRIATPDARIGLPETRLGIMPGFGGSVRLPRLLGADSALEIIASGKDVDAQKALAIVPAEKLQQAALTILRDAIAGQQDWRARRQPKLEPLKLSKLKDINPASLEQGMKEVARLLNKQLERGKIDRIQLAGVTSTIHPTLDYAGFERVDIVVEAVVENPKVKAAVLARALRR